MCNNKNLSKLFKEAHSEAKYNKFICTPRAALKWWKTKKKKEIKIKSLSTGKPIHVRDIMAGLTKDFYREVTLEAANHPGLIQITYLGAMEIVESSYVSGKPRPIPDGNGGYKYVVDDYFTRYTKYVCDFYIRKSRIRRELRQYLSVKPSASLIQAILKKAYKKHPKGKFYRDI